MINDFVSKNVLFSFLILFRFEIRVRHRRLANFRLFHCCKIRGVMEEVRQTCLTKFVRFNLYDLNSAILLLGHRCMGWARLNV